MFYSFFVSFFNISVMATKSSLCRQTVWASKPQTASWSELVTTNNYQIHHSDLEKAIKQSGVLLHSKVKKVRNKQLLFPLYPFTFNSLWHSTPQQRNSLLSSDLLCISHVHLPWREGDFVLMKWVISYLIPNTSNSLE